MTRKKALVSDQENVVPKVKTYKLRGSDANDGEPQKEQRFSSVFVKENLIPVKKATLRSRNAIVNEKENLMPEVRQSKRCQKASIIEPKASLISHVKNTKLRVQNTNVMEPEKENRIPETKKLTLQIQNNNVFQQEEKVNQDPVKISKLQSHNTNVIKLQEKENVIPKVRTTRLRGRKNVIQPAEKENRIIEVKNSKLQRNKVNVFEPEKINLIPEVRKSKRSINANLIESKKQDDLIPKVRKSILQSQNVIEPAENTVPETEENIAPKVRKSKRRLNAYLNESTNDIESKAQEKPIPAVRKSILQTQNVFETKEKITPEVRKSKRSLNGNLNQSKIEDFLIPRARESRLQTQLQNVIEPKEKNTAEVRKLKRRLNAKENESKIQENLVPRVRKSILQTYKANAIEAEEKENATPAKRPRLQREITNISESQEKDAIYEFTYDPKEEPKNKKGRKQKVKNKARTRPKLVAITNRNYEKNITNKLQTLKNTLQEKSNHEQVVIQPLRKENEVVSVLKMSNKENAVPTSVILEGTPSRVPQCDEVPFDYSPAPLPKTPQALTPRVTRSQSSFREEINHKDPLNLLDEPSFDYEPVASSSFNTSVRHNTSIRHPEASPWRVEFNELPIKWQVNSYTKANMTPAVETSYVNFNESQKKHVYTNLLPEAEETLPDIVSENEGVRLRQTTLIDFITDAAVRSVKKQKRKALKETDVPSRANLPKTALNFCPSSELVNKLYNEMKTANEAPVVPTGAEDVRDIDAEENASMVDNDDSQSCHLFEDVDLVHHVKPLRKSYGRAKKLTFAKSTMDSMMPTDDVPSDLEEEEAQLSDATFELPNVKNNRKIQKKKKATKQNKKEAEEVEAWAAAFNSMCEDVDEFDLVIE